MRLLGEAAAATMIRLDDMGNQAKRLVSELDSLDIRLHRALAALCIDSYVAYLNTQRKRMLKDEKQAETNASLARLPALGVYGLFSLFTGQEPDWKRAVSSVFREESFGDIRIAASGDDMKLINVSETVRERGIAVAEVVRLLERAGYKVFTWPEFEARAEKLKLAVLRGEAAHLGIEKAGLEYIRALTTSPGAVDIPIGHSAL